MLLPTGLDPWVLRLKHIPGCWSPPRSFKDFWLARQVYLVLHSWMLPLYRQDDGTLTSYQVSEVTALKERGPSAATCRVRSSLPFRTGVQVDAGFPTVNRFLQPAPPDSLHCHELL